MLAAAVSSPFLRVTINPGDIGPAWAGHPTVMACHIDVVTGNSFRLQYVTWTKVSQSAGVLQREFVYEYDTCSSIAQSYGSLSGRAQMVLLNHSMEETQRTILPLPVRYRYLLSETFVFFVKRKIYTLIKDSTLLFFVAP
jgi:hypothetical protein